MFGFSFDTLFRLGTFPPRGTVGCATFPFRVGFGLLSRPPRHDGSLREGFDFGFPCLRACVILQFAFFRLAPQATPTKRGRVLTVVGLAIARSRLAPPATPAVRGRFGRISLLIVSAFPSIIFFAFFLAS